MKPQAHCFIKKAFLLILLLFLMRPVLVNAAETVCAEVRIQIKQELTLERQAFDANLKINNDLEGISLEDVNIQIEFKDNDGNSVIASSDPNDLASKFFITLDSHDGLTSVNGGSIAPQTSADIHWLIIPTKGAANDNVDGEIYFVGASLSYSVGTEVEELEVAPDFIRVKPLPNISLDYFLTKYVEGDNPLTSEIEAVEPFTLGVRVSNNGIATAKNLKIESAQPEIVSNELGLLIDFKILSSYVDDQLMQPSLTVDFGDIGPGAARMGRWQMMSTLSGEFVKLDATISHSDELGGQATSIVDIGNVYLLERDVLVDIVGRDNIKDFLASDNGSYFVYESSGLDTPVVSYLPDDSETVIFSRITANEYSLQVQPNPGFTFVKIDEPFSGKKVVKSVIRSDGKILPIDNVWFSKERENSDYSYRLNLFDGQTTGLYKLIFEDRATKDEPPIIQFIADRSVKAGSLTSFLVESTDPNGLPVEINSTNLPSGAILEMQEPGRALFSWTPAEMQVGSHEIEFVADDGTLHSYRKAIINVNPSSDGDGDGMDDDWELRHFGTLDRDGLGDFDGDGVSDLDEFLESTDPRKPNFFNVKSGALTLTSSWSEFDTSGFVGPVVIFGPASSMSVDDTAIPVLKVTQDNRVLAKINEWSYQDGIHSEEEIPYLILEQGRHLMPDGSVWEAGTFELVSHDNWSSIPFVAEFQGAPKVFATLQSDNGVNSAVVKVSDVNKFGFTASLFAEENVASHGRESVSYLAIYSPVQTAGFNLSGSDFDYQLAEEYLTSGKSIIFDGVTALWLEEEASKDMEIEHTSELTNILRLNGNTFAQTVTSNEEDAYVIRYEKEINKVPLPMIFPASELVSDELVSVTIESSLDGANLFYTLDGSIPDPQNSTTTHEYIEPFEINQSTTVKALAAFEGYEKSLTKTISYNFVGNVEPQFIPISDKEVLEGSSISFMVQALDPRSLKQPPLSVQLPDFVVFQNANFEDFGNGTGRFSWVVPEDAAAMDAYEITFIATDPQDESSQISITAKIMVLGQEMLDSDSDGMPDFWEYRYGLNPHNPDDALLDMDGDEVSNKDEYIFGNHPYIADSDSSPDNFAFQVLAELQPKNTEMLSDLVLIKGINTLTPISIQDGYFQINQVGEWYGPDATEVMINNNDVVQVKQITSSKPLTEKVTTLTIGDKTAVFKTKTQLLLTTPSGLRAEKNVLSWYSNDDASLYEIQVEYQERKDRKKGKNDFNWSLYASETLDQQSFLIEGSRKPLEARFKVRSKYGEQFSQWSEYQSFLLEKKDTRPDEFYFNSPEQLQPLNTEVISENIVVRGINAPTSVFVKNGYFQINDSDTWYDQNAKGISVRLNDLVKVKHLSAAKESQITKTILSIGGRKGEFVSKTIPAFGWHKQKIKLSNPKRDDYFGLNGQLSKSGKKFAVKNFKTNNYAVFNIENTHWEADNTHWPKIDYSSSWLTSGLNAYFDEDMQSAVLANPLYSGKQCDSSLAINSKWKNCGLIHRLARENTGWDLVQESALSNQDTLNKGAFLGASVEIDDVANTLISLRYDLINGRMLPALYVFENVGGGQLGFSRRLRPPNSQAGNAIKVLDVNAEGNRFIIGSPGDDLCTSPEIKNGDGEFSQSSKYNFKCTNSGAVYEYVKSESGDWLVSSALKADRVVKSEGFGAYAKYSADDKWLAVCSNNSKKIHVFEHANGRWVLDAKLSTGSKDACYAMGWAIMDDRTPRLWVGGKLFDKTSDSWSKKELPVNSKGQASSGGISSDGLNIYFTDIGDDDCTDSDRRRYCRNSGAIYKLSWQRTEQEKHEYESIVVEHPLLGSGAN